MPFLPNVTLSQITNSLITSSNHTDNSVLRLPFANSTFTLDTSAVLGLFAGQTSVAAMKTLPLVPRYFWEGFYNSPGSGNMANHLRSIVKDPPLLLEGIYDSGKGPQFIAAHSYFSSAISGHLAYLITDIMANPRTRRRKPYPGTNTLVPSERPKLVTIVRLGDIPETSEEVPLPPSKFHSVFTSLIPVLTSVVTCVMCALVADRFCLAAIMLGMVARGFGCLSIYMARKLVFINPRAATNGLSGVWAPARAGTLVGDGILKHEKGVVVLLGNQRTVNAVLCGYFHLTSYGALERGDGREPALNSFRTLMLQLQLVAQLLLIPQGTLFGQVMFMMTHFTSVGYNILLSTMDQRHLRTQILFNVLKIDKDKDLRGYRIHTWAQTIAFTCLVLASASPMEHPISFLDAVVPENTDVWRVWKEKMSAKLKDCAHFDSDMALQFTEEDSCGVAEEDRPSLKNLLDDAELAWRLWSHIRKTEKMVALHKRNPVST